MLKPHRITKFFTANKPFRNSDSFMSMQSIKQEYSIGSIYFKFSKI